MSLDKLWGHAPFSGSQKPHQKRRNQRAKLINNQLYCKCTVPSYTVSMLLNLFIFIYAKHNHQDLDRFFLEDHIYLKNGVISGSWWFVLCKQLENQTWMGPEQAVEYCPILAFIQVRSLHCDHWRSTGLVLKHAGGKCSLGETWPIIVDVQNCDEDLMISNKQSDWFPYRAFLTHLGIVIVVKIMPPPINLKFLSTNHFNQGCQIHFFILNTI